MKDKIFQFFIWCYLKVIKIFSKCKCECDATEKCVSCNVQLNNNLIFDRKLCVKCFFKQSKSHPNGFM